MSDEGNYTILYTYCSILAMVTVFLLRYYIWRKKCLGERDKHADNLLCLNIYYRNPLNYFSQTLYTTLQFSFIEQLSNTRQFIRPWGLETTDLVIQSSGKTNALSQSQSDKCHGIDSQSVMGAQMATKPRSLQPEGVKAFRKRILLSCGVDILKSE